MYEKMNVRDETRHDTQKRQNLHSKLIITDVNLVYKCSHLRRNCGLYSQWRSYNKFSAQTDVHEVNTAGYHERTAAVYDLVVTVSFVVISKHSRV